MNSLKTRKRVIEREQKKREPVKLTDEERKKIEGLLRFTDVVNSMTRGEYK